MQEPALKLTIYYNRLCPICKAGINRQERKMLALVKSAELEFRDINDEPDRLAQFGASLEDIRKKLHATQNSGQGEELLIGADVAIEIWRHTPGEGWIAALLGNALMRPVTHLSYNMLAHFLYGWNKRKAHW